jgi:hypothetical protein
LLQFLGTDRDAGFADERTITLAAVLRHELRQPFIWKDPAGQINLSDF